MKPKRVLIVDDEPNVTAMLASSLEETIGECVIETAHSGDEALNKVQRNPYSLLITDYNMPGMTGLDLAQAVRNIAPETQVVLMTAYGTERLRDVVDTMNLDGFISKPFTIDKIREIVRQAVGVASQAHEEDKDPYRSGEIALDNTVYEQLKTLHVNTGAWCVLLISSGGYPVGVVGQTTNLDVDTVSALVAANFMAATELANLLGSDASIFKSSYHEGDSYNIYSYDVNGELLLVVIFGAGSKPGVVWFYTKQTAAELAEFIPTKPETFTFADEDEVDAALDQDFDDLFGGGDDGFGLGDDAFGPEEEEEENEAEAEPAPQPPQKSENSKPMTFEQAVAAGLVPRQIMDRERDK